MEVYENPVYQEDVREAAKLSLPWEKLADTTVLLSGATGLVGSFLVDVLMYRNRHMGMHCRVYALGRNQARAMRRFGYCADDPLFRFTACDINKPLPDGLCVQADYVLHLASNTHPVAYATDPIGTVTTNIIGTYHMLEYAAAHGARRCLFASSNEIYGENRGDVELFDESYCGYIDCNTMRAGYPESKRCGEALCQSFLKQKGLDVVIPRLTRSYGPTLLETDTKALSQFLHKAAAGEDIVLKSAGTQYYSYLYAADSVTGLLTVLLLGKCGEAYNVSDAASDIRLKDLAAVIAQAAGRQVIFELPDAVESAGYSTATKARLDGTKLRSLGWQARYPIPEGIGRTLAVLKTLK